MVLGLTFSWFQAEAKRFENDQNRSQEKNVSYFEIKGNERSAQTAQAGAANPILNYHGGKVLYAANTYAIFWGSAWSSPAFASDKLTGVDSFFQGFGGSSYAKTSNEYYGSRGSISSNSRYHGHMIINSTPPLLPPKTSTIVSKVCKVTKNSPDPKGIYFVYSSAGAGNTKYCAWHSWGTCSNGAKVQVAYIPNLDGVDGCDPVDDPALSGHSQGLAAIANVTAHELLEGITDARGSGWYDSSGAENGDKCAWVFPPGDGLSSFYDGTGNTYWKLQMEWSNSAYQTNSGLANPSGQKGCIY
jgi:hypothetical protein